MRWMWEGSEEDVWARITELEGKDISGVDVAVMVRSDRVTPDPDDPGWQVPTDTDPQGAVLRLAKFVVGEKVNGRDTRWWVWVRLIDGDERYILKMGFFTVR